MPSKQAKGVEIWDEVFSRCLQERVDFPEFVKLIVKASSKAPVSGQVCLSSLMKHDHVSVVDPRLLIYVELLLQKGIVDIPDVLSLVLQMFGVSVARHVVAMSPPRSGRKSYEVPMLNLVTHELSENRKNSSDSNAKTKAIAISRPFGQWLAFFSRNFNSVDGLSGSALEVANALGQFAVSFINHLSLVGLLDGKITDVVRKPFRNLPNFIALLSHPGVELAHNLDLLHKQFGLQERASLEGGLLDESDLKALTYNQGVLDIPSTRTRAAPFIYLNAMLVGRPLCDDAAMIDYLNARYNDDVSALIIDLVTASFDVLANAIQRQEPPESITLIRSFITNKLPTTLYYFSPMTFLPFTVEYCITQALNRMGPAAYPSYTQEIDLLGGEGLLADARSEFLFACALHQLIPEQSIEGILGDIPMQSMAEGGKYVKDDLVLQCTANPGRIEELIRELEKMEGNAGEIVGALVEIIQSLCGQKDSITLKSICNMLSRNTQVLDIVFLFTMPSSILQPLCQLIDHWHDPEDQGEHHPVYDEFGSIFLLILIVMNHFVLQHYDLGILYHGSFVLKYLVSGRTSQEIESLSEHEKQRLGDWIRWLLENEGIRDEMMSTCSPKDFHLLVATIFDQCLRACQAGTVNLETLKAGFEYLLEPFLIPSLITGLGWLAKRIWETDTDAPELAVLLPTLQALVKPPSISGDAAALHEAVLSIAAEGLERGLTHVQELHPRRPETNALLATLKQRTQRQRNDAASHTELEAWCSSAGGGILVAVRHTIRTLLQWCNAASSNTAPPNYTHKQILTAHRLLGAKAVLEPLLDELLRDPASSEAVLDIVTSMICASDSADFPATNSDDNTTIVYHRQARRQLSLRDALTILNENAYTLSKTDAPRAEMAVRLHRRVEAQLARSNQQGNNLVTDADNAMMLDLNDAGSAAMNMGQGADIDHVVAGVMDDIMATGDGSFNMEL